MAQKVTSIAIEFGVKLQEFKQDLAKAGKYSDDEQKKIVSRWIAEEKKKTRKSEQEAKKRQKAEEEYQAAILGGFAKVGAAIAAAGVAAAAAFTAMRAHTNETRTQILDLNKATLLLPETLAAIQLAAGDEILSDLRTDLVDFNKKISEARRGQGELAESFAKVERAAKMQGRAFTTTDEIFRAFVQHIQDMPPSAARAELALKTFGGEGTRFMAAIGGTELSEFVELTDRFGADVSADAIKATEEWNNATEILGGLAASTTDLLFEEALALLGFRGDVRGFVKEVVIMDARFRVFAQNMGKYLTIAGAGIKGLSTVMPGSGSIPEVDPETGRIIPRTGLEFIDDIKAAYAGLKDSTAEVDKAVAQLDARYEQIDKRMEDTTETAADQREMVEMLGLTYNEASDEAVSGEERKRRALDASKKRAAAAAKAARERAAEEKKHLEEVPEMYRAAYEMAFTAVTSAAKNMFDTPVHEQLGEQLFANIRKGMDELDKDDPLGLGDDKDDDDLDDPITKAEKAIAGLSMFAEQSAGLINGVQDLLLKKFEGNAAKQKKVMRDMFAAQKAIAISDIIIAGAVAIANAFKLDPLFGAIMTPIIAANSAVQIAVVASEQPSFHTGGVVPASGMAPDETSITALSGEGVVSRRGMAALDQINRGELMGGAAPVVVYGARIFNEVDADLARMPGSSMSRAIRSRTRRRIGHRN